MLHRGAGEDRRRAARCRHRALPALRREPGRQARLRGRAHRADQAAQPLGQTSDHDFAERGRHAPQLRARSEDRVLGALDGIRIIDLTQMLAGPFCTMMLADQGADVIKVEPLDGDDTRTSAPTTPTTQLRAFGGYFASINRNKKSIVLDLKSPRAARCCMRLVRRRRCRGRELPRRRHGPPRPGLRVAARAQPQAGLCHDPRLRRSAHRREPLCRLAGLRRRRAGDGRLMGITGPDKDTPIKVGPGSATSARHLVRRRHRQRHAARAKDRPRPVRRRRHGRCRAVDVRAHRAPARLHRRRAGAGGQPPSAALPVRHVPGPGRLRHHRGPADALADPLPPDRQARDGHRPAGSPPCRTAAPTRTRSSPRCRTSRASAPSRSCWSISAARCRSRRSTTCATSSPIRTSPRATCWSSMPHPGLDHETRIAGVPIKLTETPGRVRHRAPLLGEHTDEYLTCLGLQCARKLRACGPTRSLPEER